MNRSPFECRSCRCAVSPWPDRVFLHELPHLIVGVVGRHHPQQLAVEAEDERPVGFAQLHRALCDGLKHRLQIENGAADDSEHVGSGGLLLKGLAQLVEQARILDRDHSLTGEARNKLDLLVGEGPYLAAIDSNGADQLVVFQHRHDKIRASSPNFHKCNARWLTLGIGGLGGDVGNVDGLLCLQKLPNGTSWVRSRRIMPKMFRERRRHLTHGSGLKDISVITEENAKIGPAKAGSISEHGSEYRLELTERG